MISCRPTRWGLCDVGNASKRGCGRDSATPSDWNAEQPKNASAVATDSGCTDGQGVSQWSPHYVAGQQTQRCAGCDVGHGLQGVDLYQKVGSSPDSGDASERWWRAHRNGASGRAVPISPFYQAIPIDAMGGNRIFKVTNKGTASFYDASGNILFHWNPRFSEGGGAPPVVVRNSRISGKWGTEQRSGSWPFTGLSNTDVLITTGKSGFEITIGGKRMAAFDFKYRSSAAVSRIEGATEGKYRALTPETFCGDDDNII